MVYNKIEQKTITEKKTEWFDINNKVPEIGKEVFLAFDFMNNKMLGIGFLTSSGDFFNARNVTHWADLPSLHSIDFDGWFELRENCLPKVYEFVLMRRVICGVVFYTISFVTKNNTFWLANGATHWRFLPKINIDWVTNKLFFCLLFCCFVC